MDFKDFGKKLVKMGAPMLGTAVGGPAGGALGSLVAKMFNADPEDPQDMMLKIEADPEAAVKLQQLEKDHKVRLEELALEQYALGLKDVASARAREADIVRTTGKKDINLYALAWCVVCGFFILCWVLMKYPIPTGQSEAVFMLFGAVSTGFGTVLAYFFGSSKSSSDKTRLLAP